MTAKVNEELAAKIDDFRSKTRIPSDVVIKQTGQVNEKQKPMPSLNGTGDSTGAHLPHPCITIQFTE
jgi:hypothetical protein